MIFSPLPGKVGVDYRLTQCFHSRPEYYIKYGLKEHAGLDFAPMKPGQKGIILYAPCEGYVKYTDEGKIGFGRYVEIISEGYNREGDRRKVVLAHLEKLLVPNGSFVAQGDRVAIMGNTGDSSNFHTHLGYKKLDPFGQTVNKNNGNLGNIDVTSFIRQWTFDVLPC